MNLEFRVEAPAFEGYLEQKLASLEAAFVEKLNILDAELQRRIVANLQGPILNQITGKAARSVEMIPATISGSVIEGSVQAGGGPAYYLRFQEEGTEGPYEIAANKTKALAFLMNGKMAFFLRVQHPGLQARRPVGITFEQFQSEIIAGLKAVPGEVA